MTKYVIKVVSTAKDSNPSFAGDVNIYYYGKAQCLLVSKNRYENNLPYLDIMSANYGYNRECDAKKSWIYRNPAKNREFWEDEVIEIIKVEVN